MRLLVRKEGGASSSESLDEALLASVLEKPMKSAKLFEALSGKMGGLSGDFAEIQVLFQDGEERTLVVKRTRDLETARRLGTAREGEFFRAFRSRDVRIPKAYYGHGDLRSGVKEILMDKLVGTPAGVDFGPGNPNNWGCQDVPDAVEETIAKTTREAFEIYASLHAQFWCDPSLREHEWLRGSSWKEDEWLAAQDVAKDKWDRVRGTKIAWDSHVVRCLDASFAKISVPDDHEVFSLVHGDAHPHNFLRLASGELVMIDFEMVGVGSPFQDLGQFLISHAPPPTRRRLERDLVRHYRDELAARLPSSKVPSFDDVFAEYLAGGAGRWLWFVPYLADVCPPAMGQFFHDQLAAFLHDHFPDPASAPMPRV